MRTIIISRYALAAGLLLAVSSSLQAASHEYEIRLAEDLGELQVTAHFARPQTRIRARSGDARRFLQHAENCDSGETIASSGRQLQTGADGLRCLSYRVDLRAAAAANGRNRNLHPGNVVVSPSVWLWRPLLGSGDEIIATVRAPEGMAIALPWNPLNADRSRYRLARSPQSGNATAVFGRFEQLVVQAAGASFYVSFVRAARPYRSADLADWIATTARNIAQAYGRFPNPGVHVIVLPRQQGFWSGNSAVSFGRVVRDGGESIELMINPERPLAEFYDSWTATHEFSHLMLPYLRRESRWISEGFAQYYQNVLLARAGQYSEQRAWQKIVDGLRGGAASAPGMSPNDAARSRGGGTRMKVYWSGAALALMADVELRRRSGGRRSLDALLGELQSCCLPSTRSWSGLQLFRQLDSLLAEPLFVPLYREYADAGGFPDSGDWLDRLGVRANGRDISLDGQAELAHIRSAIMRRDPG